MLDQHVLGRAAAQAVRPSPCGVTRRGLLGIGAAGLLVAGCATGDGPTADRTRGREITHPLGVSVVPDVPARVVSLDSSCGLQVALEVGASLVASETLQGATPIPDYLPTAAPGFVDLGFNQLALERLAGLQPDLIVGNVQRVQREYDLLSAIAPTFSYANAGSGAARWQDSVRAVGDVLGGSARIDRLLGAYQARVDAIAARHRDRISSSSTALLRFTTDELRIVRGGIFGAAVLSDLGVRRPPSTDTPGPSDTFLSVGPETVGVLADADVLLCIVGGGGFVDGAEETFTRYTTGGLWERLPAVRAGRVARLDATRWWDGLSVSAGQACLDEIDDVLAELP